MSRTHLRNSAEGTPGAHNMRNNVLLGRSAINKRSNFLTNNGNNPFKEQLELDSRELMVELLERNRHHNLTDFQK